MSTSISYIKNTDGTVKRIETTVIETDAIVSTAKESSLDTEIAGLQQRISELLTEKAASIAARKP